MKKIYTQVLAMFFSSLFILFISCNDLPVNKKSYSAAIGHSQNSKVLPNDDVKFLFEAYSLAHYNLQLANEAIFRSTATESSALAKSVIVSSQEMKEELSKLAAEYDLQLPEDMTQEQKELWKDLVKQKGWDFDKKFSSTIERNLKHAYTFYEQASTSVQDESMRNVASKALTDLKQQGDLAILQQEKIKQRTAAPAIKEDEVAANTKKKKE